MGILEYILQFDQQLFHFLNHTHTPMGDVFFATISKTTPWIPIYALLLLIIYRKFGLYQTLLILASITVLITLADQTASGFLKPYFQRFRPCRPEAMLPFEVMTVANKCGHSYGFVSSHAANFFALATFLSILFKHKTASILMLTVAFIVGFSRIYLGVHFPLDVFFGGLVGVFWAKIVWEFYQAMLITTSIQVPS